MTRTTTSTNRGIDTPAGDGAETATPPLSDRIARHRLLLVDVLIGVTTVLAVVGMLSVWANRLLFNPDNWENSSTQLLQNSQIRDTTANYIVNQLYANVNVAGLIKSGLPTRLQPLAGPAAGALQNAAVQGVERALTIPTVQTLWARANRAADQTFIAIVNGGKGVIGVNGGVVTLDLASVVSTVAARLGLPPNLSSKLPPTIGHLQIFRSDQIKYLQDGGRAVRGLALWLTIIVPLLYALAIALARGHRRRTLMSVGFAITFAGLLGEACRSLLKSQITSSLVHDATLRPAVRAVIAIGTSILGQIAGAFILVGLVVVAVAWFAGPARTATGARRAIAPQLREYPVAAFGATAAVIVILSLWDPIPATGTVAGIVVFMLLALFGTEMLRRQTAVEFPDARSGDAMAAMRQRLRALREGRKRDASPPSTTATLPDQLERLATLRHDGEITPAEYDTAKANLLRV